MRLLLALLVALLSAPLHAAPPNIVYILADDMGYGDLKANNPEGKIPTPHLDRLAAQGMRFTDAHTSSSVCTPTRYSIQTGRYNWRTKLQSGVLGGFSPRLIEDGRLTVASLLKQHGYQTACIGKWHLGMDFPLKSRGSAQDYADGSSVDWSRDIVNGPRAVGYDYYYGISASLDMPPYVFIEDERAVETPDREEELWPKRKGPVGPTFKLEEVLPRFAEKAVAFIRQQKPGKPFFIYMPLNSPHTPIVPNAEWRGKSGLNAYADFVMETDHYVGKVLEALEAAGVAENTLVVFTSDNGCSPQANFPELREKGHDPSRPLRGHKADIFDGGHRVPFLVRWPGKVKAGSVSDALVCTTDLMATVAEVLGVRLPDNAGEDSISMLPVLTGSAGPRREVIIHHSINGSFAIREGKWKLQVCRDSGGWSDPRPGTAAARSLPDVQLFDMTSDIGEQKNLHAEHPDVVARLRKLLDEQVAAGRTTPGSRQSNAVNVDIDAAPKKAAAGAAKQAGKNKRN